MPIFRRSNVTATHSSFAGEEFSNNLLGDLAPLLTLFGEQVTKQFLTMSMGWADNILIALGPLGILTIMVSAIRVAGPKQLKALVGRARENKAAAEAEILSSTSPEVCELWNGKEIVREFGTPNMTEVFVVEHRGKIAMRDLLEVYDDELLTPLSAKRHASPSGQPTIREQIEQLSRGAPNLALNIPTATARQKELCFWVAWAVLAQMGVLILPAIATYRWKWMRGNNSVPSYGYPCFVLGSVAIVIGLMLCSHTIEASTTEFDFTPNRSKKVDMQVLRLQEAGTVNNRFYGWYIILCEPRLSMFRTSRLNDKDFSKIVAFAALTTVFGFVCQFIGLRALHWFATLAVLSVTILMVGVRAWVRRGLTADPICVPVPEFPEPEFSSHSHRGLLSSAWAALYIDSRIRVAESKRSRPLDWSEEEWNNPLAEVSDSTTTQESFRLHFELITGAYMPSDSPTDNLMTFYPAAGAECQTGLDDAPLFEREIDFMWKSLWSRDRSGVEVWDRLSRSIEKTMDLLTSDNRVSWVAGSPPRSPFKWYLNHTRAIPTGSHPYSTTLQKSELSLCRGTDSIKTRWLLNYEDKLRAIATLSECSMRLRLGEMVPPYPEPFTSYGRIVGSATPSTLNRALQKLQRWTSSTLYSCPVADGSNTCCPRRADTISSKEPDRIIRQWHAYPVFGFRYSSLYCNKGKIPADPIGDPRLESPHGTTYLLDTPNEEDCHTNTQHSRYHRANGDGSEPPLHTEILIFGNRHLDNEIATEIFVTFLDQLIAGISGIAASTTTAETLESEQTYSDSYDRAQEQDYLALRDIIDGLKRVGPIATDVIVASAFLKHGLLVDPLESAELPRFSSKEEGEKSLDSDSTDSYEVELEGGRREAM